MSAFDRFHTVISQTTVSVCNYSSNCSKSEVFVAKWCHFEGRLVKWPRSKRARFGGVLPNPGCVGNGHSLWSSSLPPAPQESFQSSRVRKTVLYIRDLHTDMCKPESIHASHFVPFSSEAACRWPDCSVGWLCWCSERQGAGNQMLVNLQVQHKLFSAHCVTLPDV